MKDDAVSPVVAVILLVAITVALSAVVGAFALDLGQQTTNSQQSSVGVKTGVVQDGLKVTVITGSADELVVSSNGNTKTIVNATPGDTTTILAARGSDVTVTAVSDGQRKVVTTTTVSSSPAIPTDGLVAYYPFNGNADDMWGGTDGTVNGASLTSDAVSDQAYAFDGSGDHIDMGDAFDFSSEVTVSVWFKPQNAASSDERIVMSGNEEWGLQVHNGQLRGVIRYANDSNSVLVDSTSGISNGTWYYGTLTYNGSAARLYINGTHEATIHDSNGIHTDNASFLVGMRDDNILSFTGSVDTVHVYNRSLNESEVQDLYDATK